MTQIARQQVKPQVIPPQPEFNVGLFDAAIWEKGYNVQVEEVLECPCKQENGFLSSCKNCGGTGWIFVNPINTKAILTSINQRLEYKNWSQEAMDDISITLMNRDRLSFMSRITLRDTYSYFTEVRKLKIDSYDGIEDVQFIFTTYKPLEIDAIFVFRGSGQSLLKLPEDSYLINPYENSSSVMFTYDFSTVPNFNGSISIRYKHYIQYNVINLPHNLRASWVTDVNGAKNKVDLPVQAIGRITHQILNRDNVFGEGVMNNTWKV